MNIYSEPGSRFSRFSCSAFLGEESYQTNLWTLSRLAHFFRYILVYMCEKHSFRGLYWIIYGVPLGSVLGLQDLLTALFILDGKRILDTSKPDSSYAYDNPYFKDDEVDLNKHELPPLHNERGKSTLHSPYEGFVVILIVDPG